MEFDIKKYIPLLEFISDFLGEKTEVVLQDFTNGFDNSVVYIKNNISGREVGAPATDFVLDVYNSKVYLDKDYLVNYKTRTMGGKELQSSTYFIKRDDKLLGMICFNTDESDLFNLRELLENGIKKIDEKLNIRDKENIENITENFYSTSDNLIEAAINEEIVGKDKINLNRQEKIAIVKNLYDKGFFHLKDSVTRVAETFKMSEVSIYKYIQVIKMDEQK